MSKILKTIEVKRPKIRNPLAIEAFNRSKKAGYRQKNRRKEASRNACRQGEWR